jgi:hypothetical protein
MVKTQLRQGEGLIRPVRRIGEPGSDIVDDGLRVLLVATRQAETPQDQIGLLTQATVGEDGRADLAEHLARLPAIDPDWSGAGQAAQEDRDEQSDQPVV